MKKNNIVLIVLTLIILIGTMVCIYNKDNYNSGEHVLAGDGDDELKYGKLYLMF